MFCKYVQMFLSNYERVCIDCDVRSPWCEPLRGHEDLILEFGEHTQGIGPVLRLLVYTLLGAVALGFLMGATCVPGISVVVDVLTLG